MCKFFKNYLLLITIIILLILPGCKSNTFAKHILKCPRVHPSLIPPPLVDKSIAFKSPGKKKVKPSEKETPSPIKFIMPYFEKTPEKAVNMSGTLSPEQQDFPDTGNAVFYKFVKKWGGKGSDSGQFLSPMEIVSDREGYIYVTDSENHRIQKFDSNGKFIMKWGGHGSGQGQLIWPEGLSIDSAGNIYVADFGNDRIQKFDGKGKFLKSFGGNFTSPGKVEVDLQGNIYVADCVYKRIQKFSPSGKLINKWKLQEGSITSAIDTDASGAVYLINYSTQSTIVKYAPSGKFMTQWSIKGQMDGSSNQIGGMAIDKNGYIYLSDLSNNTVQKILYNGTFITDFGSRGDNMGQFIKPRDLTVDMAGNIYVLDGGNNRIQKFAPM